MNNVFLPRTFLILECLRGPILGRCYSTFFVSDLADSVQHSEVLQFADNVKLITKLVQLLTAR